MEEKLKEIFGYVNSWLSHAEAKNGAIVVLNGACIMGIATLLLGKDNNINNLLRIYLIVTLVILLLSTGISLISFFPMTSKFEDKGDNDNQNSIFLFYGDIAKCKNSRQYVLSIYKNYFNDSTKRQDDITRLEDDYAKEIIYNSVVTVRKYNCFKISLILTVCAFISPLIFVLGYITIKLYKVINKI
jgi:uncharacterized membrane protein